MLTAVDGQEIEYDNSGNPTSFYDGYRYTMTWTEGRKLASVTYNNKVTTFEYNHEGLRIKKTLHDGSYILYDIVDGVYMGETRYNASGSVAVYIRYILDEANNPVGISLWYPGDGRWTDYHFVKNLQGDVLKVYKVSDGSLAASYTYDSWGNILSQSGSLASINPFRYRSYYYDTQTWFYYLQSRYYDPAIGRFINADTFASTGQGIIGNNMFAYCGNNPVSCVDATGTRYMCLSSGLDDGYGIDNSYTVALGGICAIGIGSLSMSLQGALVTDSTGVSEIQLSYSAPNILSTGLPSVDEMLADILRDKPQNKFGISFAGTVTFTNAPSVVNLYGPTYSVGGAVPGLSVDYNMIPANGNEIYSGITIASGIITPGANVSMSNTVWGISVPYSVFDIVEVMTKGLWGVN